MSRHEFGIMDVVPKNTENFEKYEPQKFHCISVHDDYIEPLLEEFSKIQCYWHSLSKREKGLAYCGISLIPPESMQEFISAIEKQICLTELKNLLEKARQENKFVIHFGI